MTSDQQKKSVAAATKLQNFSRRSLAKKEASSRRRAVSKIQKKGKIL